MRNYSFQLFSKREKAQSKTTTSQLVDLRKHNNKTNAYLGRKSKNSIKQKWSFRVYTSFDRILNKFVVRATDLIHNHGIGKEIYDVLYPRNQKLCEKDLENAKEDTKLDPDMNKLIEKNQSISGKIILKKIFTI